VEQYVKWVQVLRKRGYIVDGIVLTEHRKFDYDKDYSALAEQNGLLILKGAELDTRFGHVLVYGVSEGLTRDIDFSDVRMDARELNQAARQHERARHAKDVARNEQRQHHQAPPMHPGQHAGEILGRELRTPETVIEDERRHCQQHSLH